ncbi:sodium/proline symporter PutP [Streptomyces gilvosporeus]|uniref:Sodium/proline symporter n=1 Tax=Streptomyces gilvosporeus TaxID=553510 RepID=A0A1V0TZY7_9ACTN|nr:sodium/proline symporter PutP [Streptomyces gilvosporeus]ARF58358.1 sodium/proline symporter [Streptomyces gilvosporeus]
MELKLTQIVPVMLIFGIFTLALIASGIAFYEETRTFAAFALGDRRLNAFTAALSAEASDMSGWLFLGLPGAVYAAGVGATWIAVGLVIGTYLNWRFVAPRLRAYTQLANNSVTLSAYLEERFEDDSRVLRTVSAAVTIVFSTIYVASGLAAGGMLVGQLFGTGFTFGLTVFAAVMVTYSALGGFRAVSTSHSVQGTLMVLAAFALPVIGIWQLGGLGPLLNALTSKAPSVLDMSARTSFADGQWGAGKPLGAVAAISMLAWGLGYFGQPHILARFMGISSTHDIPAARRTGVSWLIIALTGAVLIGLIGIAQLQHPLGKPELVYIALSTQLSDPWITGVLLVAVLAAIKSTADSQLLVSATSLADDFVRAFLYRRASDAALVWIARGSVIGVALVAYAIALCSGDAVLDIVAYAWAGFGSAFGPVLLLSLYWPRMTKAGALTGMVAGALTVALWKHIDPLLGPLRTGLYAMVPGVLAATAAALLFGAFVGHPPLRTWAGPQPTGGRADKSIFGTATARWLPRAEGAHGKHRKR